MAITSIGELDKAISILEVRRELELIQLRNHARETLQSLRPANLVKAALKDIASSPSSRGQVLKAVLWGSFKLLAGVKENRSPGVLSDLVKYALSSVSLKSIFGKLSPQNHKVDAT
jgi:hypothetical protein